MMTTKEILDAARAKIDTPEKWASSFSEVEAGKECALTALCMGGTNYDFPHWEAYTILCSPFLNEYSLGEWNDTHSHDQVLALYDAAIAEVISKEALS
jgi:hypothetical protein